MANEEEMDDEVIEDFVEPGPEEPVKEVPPEAFESPEGIPENAPSEKPKAVKEVKEEKKPEVKKETSRPNEKTEAPKAKSFSVDSMVTNAAGIPRPKVELRNGREALLTRALLAEIGDYDERGTPKNNFCEELQKVERLTKLLTLWENGVSI